jgi:hypothetical protein
MAGVAHGVDPGTADEGVVAEPTVEVVVAAAAVQNIGSLVAGDRFGEVRTGDIGEFAQHVGLGNDRISAGGGVPRQAISPIEPKGNCPNLSGHTVMACEAHRVVEDVTADQSVVAEAAVERVSAARSVQRITQLVADNSVGADASNDVLDTDQGIDRGLDEEEVRRAARPKLGGGAVGTVEAELHCHAIEEIDLIGEEKLGVVGGIGPAHAIESVVSWSAGEHVIIR